MSIINNNRDGFPIIARGWKQKYGRKHFIILGKQVQVDIISIWIYYLIVGEPGFSLLKRNYELASLYKGDQGGFYLYFLNHHYDIIDLTLMFSNILQVLFFLISKQDKQERRLEWVLQCWIWVGVISINSCLAEYIFR